MIALTVASSKAARCNNVYGEHTADFEARPSFGYLLRKFRLALNLSQEALAERAGLSSCGISALERGVRRQPQRYTVALLTAALNLSLTDRERLQTAAKQATRPRRWQLPPTNSALGFSSPNGSRALVGRTQDKQSTCAGNSDRVIADHFADGHWYVVFAPSDSAAIGPFLSSGTMEIVVRYQPAEPRDSSLIQTIGHPLPIAPESAALLATFLRLLTPHRAAPSPPTGKTCSACLRPVRSL